MQPSTISTKVSWLALQLPSFPLRASLTSRTLPLADPKVNGILVQLPLPPHINEAAVLHRILPEKDVDGLHPLNVAQLANTKTHAPGRATWSFDSVDFHVSCTPQGCIELLDRSGVTIEGKEAVVLGRSNIVGIPVALLLMQRNATVTIAHSRTADIEATVRRADIVIAAVGRAEMVRGSWIKPGAVVIDVGVNSVDDPTDKRGYRLVGDVNYAEASQVASKITPVRCRLPLPPFPLSMASENVCETRQESSRAGRSVLFFVERACRYPEEWDR